MRCWVFALLFVCLRLQAQTTTEIDNTWVHVTRVKLAPHQSRPPSDHPAAVVVYLSDTHEHKDGDTAWLAPGKWGIDNPTDHAIEEVITELKPGAGHPPSPPITLDPVKLDPKYHTADFENDRVRILRTVLEPHIKSPMHQHPAYVVVYITELHTTMALADGKLVDNVRERGAVAWRDAMQHSTENLGNRTAMEIQIELK